MPFISKSPELVAAEFHITLADTLEEKIKIETFPVGINLDAICIARFAVADYLSIARIIYRALAVSDFAVTVKISEFKITRIPSATVYLTLVCMSGNFLLGLEKTLGFESPDFTPNLTYIMIGSIPLSRV